MPSKEQLMNMLGGAKKLMDVVESGDFETGKVNPNALTESGVKTMMSENQGGIPTAAPTVPAGPTIVDGKPQYKNMATSKLPDAIKQAMMESPIEQISSPNHTFNLDDVEGLVEKDPVYFTNQKKTKPQVVNEVIDTKRLVGLNENQVRGIVQEEIIEFFAKYFTKTLTEDVHKKVMAQVLRKKRIK